MYLKIFSYAKINLTLEVLYRRPDGFHELETILQELLLADTLYLEDLPGGKIELSCDHPLLPTDGSNLICRAASLFQAKFAPGRGVKIRLEKKIPVAAGLGGGSSNAAAVLKGLQMLWDIPLPQENLLEPAAGLGSDVSFFLYGGTALGTGRGEKIRPLSSFPKCKVLLVAPAGLTLSTARVYGSLLLDNTKAKETKTGEFVRLLEKGKEMDVFPQLLGLLTNDLEKAAFALKTEIALLKKKLQSLGLAVLLSGSGPTLFALSREEGKLEQAWKELHAQGYTAILTETKGPYEQPHVL